MKLKLGSVSAFIKRLGPSASAIFWIVGIFLLLINYWESIVDYVQDTISLYFQLYSEHFLLDMALLCITIAITIWILRTSLIRFRLAISELDNPTSSSIVFACVYTFPKLFLWFPKYLFDRYRESSLAHVLETLQPVSTVLAVIALFVTSYGLWLTILDTELRTKQMHATLRVTLDEKLAAASTFIDPDNFDFSKCAKDIPTDGGVLSGTLERMVALGVPLDGVRALSVPLNGLSLENIELDYGQFSLSDLTVARFSGVTLSRPEFFCSNLVFAKFTDAKIASGDFRLANLRDADFLGLYAF